MTTDLVGKYFVVTGGTAGVGEATAALLAERGAAGVAICGRNAERGEAVRSALAARGCRSVFIKADLAKIEDCFGVVDAVIEEFGRLDSLINCCGSTERGRWRAHHPSSGITSSPSTSAPRFS